MSIPLNSSRLDAWFWAFESSGQFSVKSTYRYMQLRKDGGSQTSRESFWSKLWKLRVPPKVKNLLWRAATGCLPTKAELRLKHVNIDITCPLCHADRELINHCLVECPIARACWNQTGIGVITHVQGTFAAWLEGLFQTLDVDQLKIVAMTCWAL